MKKSSKIMRSFRHGINRHFAVLDALIEKDDYGSIRKYLNTIIDETSKEKTYSETGNIIVDSIVNFELGNVKVNILVKQALQ